MLKKFFREKENDIRNLNLHKERKNIRKGIDEGKIYIFMFRILNLSNKQQFTINSNSNNIISDYNSLTSERNDSNFIRKKYIRNTLLYGTCTTHEVLLYYLKVDLDQLFNVFWGKKLKHLKIQLTC